MLQANFNELILSHIQQLFKLHNTAPLGQCKAIVRVIYIPLWRWKQHILDQTLLPNHWCL